MCACVKTTFFFKQIIAHLMLADFQHMQGLRYMYYVLCMYMYVFNVYICITCHNNNSNMLRAGQTARPQT